MGWIAGRWTTKIGRYIGETADGGYDSYKKERNIKVYIFSLDNNNTYFNEIPILCEVSKEISILQDDDDINKVKYSTKSTWQSSKSH